MNPIYKDIFSLNNIPDELAYKLKLIDGTVYLVSNALFQPIIVLFPQLKIEGDRWIFYSKKERKLYELVDNKLNVLSNEAFLEADNIYYVNIEGKIEKIIEKSGEFIYNNEKYSKQYINEDASLYILSNKRKILIFWDKNLLEYDKPKYVSFNNNILSLVYDKYTEIIAENGHYKLNVEAIYLGKVWGKDLYRTLDGKIYLNDTAIGICKEKTELIGYNSKFIIIRCGNSVKYFEGNVWKTVNFENGISGGFVSDRFIIIKTNNNTIVYNKEFMPIYFLSPCEDAVSNSNYIFLYHRKTFGIIEASRNDEIIKVEKAEIDESPAIVKVKKFYTPIFIDFDVINVENDEEGLIYYVEPKRLGSKEGKIELRSPFFTTVKNIKIESKEPYIFVEGEIIKTSGYVLYTDKNSVIKLKVYGNIRSFLPYKIKILFRNNTFTYSFNKQVLNEEIKIPVNIFDQNLTNDVIIMEIIKSDILQTKEEILLPVINVLPDKNLWKKEIINFQDYVIKLLRQENDEITWKKVYIYPTYRKGLIVKPEGKIISLGGKKVVVKKGVHIIGDNIIVGIDDNIIDSILVKVDFPYLLVSPKIKEKYPLEIFYSTYIYRGFPANVMFPIDPAYNEIITRVYIGNEIIEKRFIIPKELFLKIAYLQAKSIQEFLKSIGIE